MCVVNDEGCLAKKNLTNQLNTDLLRQELIEKTINGIEKQIFFQEKKFRIQWSEKKIMLTMFWDMKGSMTIDFLEKGGNSKLYFLLPIP